MRAELQLAHDRWSFLAPGQKQLLLAGRLSSSGSLYNSALAFELLGLLDLDALNAAIRDVLERQKLLRTVIVEGHGAEPYLRLCATPDTPLRRIDLADADLAHREHLLARTVEELRAEEFDLGQMAPFRAAVIRLADEEHVLCCVIHHIAWDGASAEVLSRQLWAAYRRRSGADINQRDRPADSATLDYADYVERQLKRVDATELARQTRYWAGQLRGVPAAADLPLDRPRPPMPRNAGAAVRRSISPEVREQLASLSSRRSISLPMALLAAWSALLHRYTGQDDLLVGISVSGRTLPEYDDLVGLFANTLVVRSRVTPDMAFTSLADNIRECMFDVLDHQDVPLDHLVETLRPPRVPGRHPLAQVFFAYERQETSTYDVDELQITLTPDVSNTAKFELSLTVIDSGTELEVNLEYDMDIFAPESAGRLLSRYARLLESVVSEPKARLVELALLTVGEEVEIVDGWNPTTPESATCDDVVSLIDEQARLTPDSVAIRQGHRASTYAEFVSQSHELAVRLADHGVRRGDVVGIHLSRSIEQSVAVLAVLRAGAVFLPLETGLPGARLDQLIVDSGAVVVLGDAEGASRVAALGHPVLTVESPIGARPVVERASDHGHADPAYLIYTSGSTGQPKGVLCSHGNLAGFAVAACDAFELTAEDRFLQLAPFGFDVYLEETFPVWIAGGCVALPPPAFSFGLDELVDLLEDHQVTVCELTTAYWNEITPAFADGRRRLPERFRLMLVGGDRPVADRIGQWQALGTALTNVYGLTETAVTSTVFHLSEKDALDQLPIGRPLANSRVYVLDEHLAPVPPGLPGEIVVGGRGVALGYLGQPGLTAERFMPDPFSAQPGARMYRTGDVGRHLPSGELEFLGRADSQVKIRGHRVEPAEVERALESHPAVAQAVVAVFEGPTGKELAAFCVPATGMNVTATALTADLAVRLPHYFVPTRILLDSTLPLSHNGKIDRAALRIQDWSKAPSQIEQSEPRDAAEAAVAEVWRAALGVDCIGVHDDFFGLGGHSLLAIRLADAVASKFLTVADPSLVFRAPTVAAYARELFATDHTVDRGGDVVLLRDASNSGTGSIIVFHALAFGVMSYRRLVRALGITTPVYGVTGRALTPDASVLRSITELAMHYADLLKSLALPRPWTLLGHSWSGGLGFEVARALSVDDAGLVQGLVLGDSRPTVFESAPADGLLAEHFLREMAQLSNVTPGQVNFAGIEEAELHQALTAATRSTGLEATAQEVTELFELYRARVRASVNHRPSGPLTAPVLLLRAEHDHVAGEPADLGWSDFAPHLRVEPVACRHADLLLDPTAAADAARLIRSFRDCSDL